MWSGPCVFVYWEKYTTTWQSQWSSSLSPHLSFLPFINLNFSLFRSLALGERGQQKGKHSLYETSSGRLWCGWSLGVVDTQSQLFLLPTWSKVWKLDQKHQPHFGNCYSLLIQILYFNKFFQWFVHTITFRKHWARMSLWVSPKFSYWQHSIPILMRFMVTLPLTTFCFSSVPEFLTIRCIARSFRHLGNSPIWNALEDSSSQIGLIYIVQRKCGLLLSS